MQLILDMGNSTIVAALMRDGEIIHSLRIPSDREKPQDFFEKALSPLLPHVGNDNVILCALSSVVPELNDTVLAAAQASLDIPQEGMKGVVTHSMISRVISIDVDNPSAVGKDRLCDCVGALSAYIPSEARYGIVIDMGTATTVNIAVRCKTGPETRYVPLRTEAGTNHHMSSDEDLRPSFLGGMIIPGVRTSLNALSQKASLLPDVRIEAPDAGIIGKNTVHAMQSGIIFGHAAMIDGIIDRMQEELRSLGITKDSNEPEPYVIATGGMARKIIPHCRHKIHCDEHLLLKGLYAIVNNP